MATMLIDGNYREATRQYNYSVPENEIIDTVLSKPEIMPADDYRNLKRFSKAEAEKDNRKKFKDKEFILEGSIKTNKVSIQNPQRRTWGQARSCGLCRTRCQSPRASF